MVPKLRGMRYIVNMGRRAANGVQTISINQQLTNLFQVLTYEKVCGFYLFIWLVMMCAVRIEIQSCSGLR